jgi:tRNA(Ile)-lysidine synthase
VEVFVDRGELLIAPQSPAPRSWTFPHAEAEHPDAPLRITTSSFNRIVLNAGTSTAWFDVDRIAWPIELRPWRPGDRMRPDGLGGSKLVSDILIDAKVPRSTKERVLVLADTDRILWLCGFRIAADVKATSASTRVLRLDLLGP